MNLDLATLLVFILVIGLFLYRNRRRIELQKIVYPVLYILLFRTNFGIRLIDRLGTRFREQVKFIGYMFIGFGFFGIFYISYAIIVMMLQFFRAPATTETVTLVLPGISVPGYGYLSFWHWIIALFVLVLLHEFAHGIVARAHGLKVKSSGFAFLAFLVPIIPAAFVEPDEKKLRKAEDVVQYSVFAAGPMINIALAILLLLLFPYVADLSGNTLAPFEEKITEPVGFSFDAVKDNPAAIAGINGSFLVTEFNGNKVSTADDVLKELRCISPETNVTVGNGTASYVITTAEHPNDKTMAYLGVNNIQNVRNVKEQYKSVAPAFYWFKGLIKWIFLFNWAIGLINLLPIFITDGARMIGVMLERLLGDRKKAMKLSSSINLLFLLLMVIALMSTVLKGLVGLF